MKAYDLTKLEHVRVHGRTTGKYESAIPLFWTGSAIEVRVNGAAFSFTYECRGWSGEMYLRCEVDGCEVGRWMLLEGVHTIPVYAGLDPEEVRTVRIFREMQANCTGVSVSSIETDGEFFPIENRPLIEFIGDSVTSGEGLMGAKHVNKWMPFVHSSRGNYALLTADALGCDWSLLSQGGWGVYISCMNDRRQTLPSVYDKVCAVARDDFQKSFGSQETADFSRHPAVTVVNLTTNDASAFKLPSVTSLEEGKELLHRHEDGSLFAEDEAKVYRAIVDFCRRIRAAHPDTAIIWGYNMFHTDLNMAVKNAIAEFAREDAKGNAYALEMPMLTNELKGSRHHPGAVAHRMYAERIVALVREKGIL